VDIGAYARGTGGTSPTRCAQFLPGPYRIPSYACRVNAHVSNKTPTGTYRGPGRVEANFFRERLIDMAAADLGIDPPTIRLRNFVAPAEMPFNIGRLVTYEPPAAFDSGHFSAVFEHAMREIGWSEKQSIQGRQVGGWFHGIGSASFVESGAGGRKEHARIRLRLDGTLDVYVGATSSGQGHETVFGQVCADELQIPLDRIRIICASTDELEESLGTWHSRSAVMAGNAVRTTALVFLERLRAIALDYFGQPNVTLELREGSFCRSDTNASASLAALAHFAAEKDQTVDVPGHFEYTGAKPFSYGTHAAHVAVDPRTGQVLLLDYVGLEDIGRVLNPLIAHGQAVGAIVQGLGGAFLEHHAIRRARAVAHGFSDGLSAADSWRFSEYPGKVPGACNRSRKSARRQGRGRGRNSGRRRSDRQCRLCRSVLLWRAGAQLTADASSCLAADSSKRGCAYNILRWRIGRPGAMLCAAATTALASMP
jgi:aerobic carbon-monoxide dehydrogenase large subunit